MTPLGYATELVESSPWAYREQDNGGDRRRAGEDQGMDAKKLAVLAALALVLFFVITNPGQAADAVHTILGWAADGANQIFSFLEHLFT